MPEDRESSSQAGQDDPGVSTRRRRSGSRRSGGNVAPQGKSSGGRRSKAEAEVSVVDPATQEQQQVLFGVFLTLLIGITFFQKIGYSSGNALAIPVILPLAYVALGAALLFAKPVFRPERVILYLVLIVVSTLSTVLLSGAYSLPSMALYYALYLPFIVAFDTTRATYRRCMNAFSTVMLIFAVIVWLQHAVQFTVGWAYWPNLDKLLPKQVLIPEFNYLQSIEWGLNLMKPSGVFFLEVSILSQFLTFALVIELVHLQRIWRAVFFGATLFATFAGTGLVLLAISLPIIFMRMNNRTFAIVLATAFVACFVALQLHWFDLVAHRLGEFQQSGSSANSRFIAPLDRIRQALTNERAVYSGVGAGQIERGGNTFWWPIVKTTVEYGLLEGILFYVFYLWSLFDNAPSRRLAFVLAIWFSFEGTLLTPLNPIACVMLSSMFIVRDEKQHRRRPFSRTISGEPNDTPASLAAAAAG